MKLILISYPVFFKGEDKIVNRLLEKFDFTLHLRKPFASFFEYERFLKKVAPHLHQKIVIHDAYDLIKSYQLKGLHFPKNNRPEKRRYSSQILTSTSCHSTEEFRTIDGQYGYSFLSPVFPSISKQAYNNVLDRESLRLFLQQKRDSKAIALGGIDAEKIKQLANYLFDGYAVLGAVWTNKPKDTQMIENNFKKIYECIMNAPIV